MKILLVLLGLVLVGCDPTVILSKHYTLAGADCQTAEVAMSMQSITTPTGCVDKNGQYHLVATQGRPTIQTIEAIATGALIGGGLYGLGTQLPADIGTDIIVGIP